MICINKLKHYYYKILTNVIVDDKKHVLITEIIANIPYVIYDVFFPKMRKCETVNLVIYQVDRKDAQHEQKKSRYMLRADTTELWHSEKVLLLAKSWKNVQSTQPCGLSWLGISYRQ